MNLLSAELRSNQIPTHFLLSTSELLGKGGWGGWGLPTREVHHHDCDLHYLSFPQGQAEMGVSARTSIIIVIRIHIFIIYILCILLNMNLLIIIPPPGEASKQGGECECQQSTLTPSCTFVPISIQPRPLPHPLSYPLPHPLPLPLPRPESLKSWHC